MCKQNLWRKWAGIHLEFVLHLPVVESLLGSSYLASHPGVGGAVSLFLPVDSREGESLHFWTKEVESGVPSLFSFPHPLAVI